MDLSHDIDLIKKRLKIGRAHIEKTTNELLDTVDAFLQATESQSDQQFDQSIETLFSDTQRILPLKAVLAEHRETYAYVSRLHKDMEQLFCVNPDLLATSSAPQFNKQLMDRAVLEQFVLEGNVDFCEAYQRERGVDIISPSIREQYQSILSLIQSLESGNLDKALELQAQVQLDKRFPFQLHKLKFVRLLKQKKVEEAIEYAKQAFEPFKQTYFADIEKLMAALIFVENLADSPYKDFVRPDFETKIIREMNIEACKYIGLPASPFLDTIVSAGIQAVPQLLQSVPLLQDQLWKTQFPVELILSTDLRFHSLFVCPVSKEVVGPDNPPMLLPCGHVICKHSLESLARSTSRGKFKCPTCPVEATARDAMQITF